MANKESLGYQNDYFLKVIFSCTFQQHCKPIPYISNLDLTVGLRKMHRFLSLKLILIPMHSG